MFDQHDSRKHVFILFIFNVYMNQRLINNIHHLTKLKFTSEIDLFKQLPDNKESQMNYQLLPKYQLLRYEQL